MNTKPLRPLVYLACPITLGDRKVNYAVAAAYQRLLMKMGYAVNNPALTMELPGAWDIPHEIWMENALPQVAGSKAVLRLPGESRGADEEVAFALSLGIPVFHSIEELQECLPVHDAKSAEAEPTSDLFAPECQLAKTA